MKPLKTTAEITFRQLVKHDAGCGVRTPWVWAVTYPLNFAPWLDLRCNDPTCPARAVVSLGFLAKLPMGERRKGRAGGVR